MTDSEEALLSINASNADIERWILQIAISRRISEDKRKDIIRAAERIAKLAKELGYD